MGGENKKPTRGFTIIEVLIVMAIAGSIMMIVFLAVPALQRNSRNTQRKTDASRLAAGYREAKALNAYQPVDFCMGNITPCYINTVPLSQYDNTSNRVVNAYQATPYTIPGSYGVPPNVDQMYVYNYLKCSDSNTPTHVGATVQSVVILFRLEGSGNTTSAQCVEI